MRTTGRIVAFVVAGGLIGASCGSDAGTRATNRDGVATTTEVTTLTTSAATVPSEPATTVPPTTAPPTTVPATTAPPTAAPTTVASTAPPTTAAATTTTVAGPASLVLRASGIGPFDLGQPVDPVYNGVIARLGEPTSDVSRAYPTVNSGGSGFSSADDSYGFAHQFGREICWANGLCISFGSSNADSLTLVGWSYAGAAPPTLVTAAGVTVGSRWSDFPVISVEPGGCYSQGGGTVDGVGLDLSSSGTPFGSYDDAGNYIAAVPAPADVTVQQMFVGDLSYDVGADC